MGCPGLDDEYQPVGNRAHLMNVSRYQAVGIETMTSPDGGTVPYLRRRFLPDIDQSSPTRVHRVGFGELHRPDLVAAMELGEAEMSWLLADANPVMRPTELCQEIGQLVRVPIVVGMNVGQLDAQ
jgi:hypothetical protein